MAQEAQRRQLVVLRHERCLHRDCTGLGILGWKRVVLRLLQHVCLSAAVGSSQRLVPGAVEINLTWAPTIGPNQNERCITA